MILNGVLTVIHSSLLLTVIIIGAMGKISNFYATKTIPMVWDKSLQPTWKVAVGDSGSTTDQFALATLTDRTTTGLDTKIDFPYPLVASFGSQSTWSYQPVSVKSYFLPKIMFIIIFIGVTAAAHLARTVSFAQGGKFAEMVERGEPRWDRWLEYSFSSPAMLIVIAGSTGVNDAWVLALLSVCQFTLCLYGYAIEVFDYQINQEKEVENVEEGQNLPAAIVESMYRTMNLQLPTTRKIPVKLNVPWTINNIGRQYTTLNNNAPEAMIVNPNDIPLASPVVIKGIMRWAKYLFFLNGLYTFFFQWFCIILSFWQTSNYFHELNKPKYLTDLTNRIPEMIIAFEFVLFALFPIVQFFFNFWINQSINKNYGWSSEIGYGILSALSKAVLTILLIMQAYQQKLD